MEIIKSIFTLKFSLLEISLLGIFVFFWLIQLSFYLFKYLRFVTKKNKSNIIITEPVSVIICAKNEEENLKNNLESFLTQDYPNYEVIVVNDCSHDETEIVLAEMKQKYSHLKVTAIVADERFSHGKKLPLTIGIKAASNDILLLSDADCKPASNQWISKMAQNFTVGIEIVLGYGGYESKKGLLNSLIRFDTYTIALQYFSYALVGKTYMGVGRNLAYRKSLFFKHKGFASHLKFMSGDDDLFINEAATIINTKIEYSPESHTISVPKTTFPLWFKQKQRHLTTGVNYKAKHKFSLSLEYASRILFYLMIIPIAVLFPNVAGIVVLSFLIRMIIQLIVYKITMKRLNEKNLLLSSLLFDIIMPFINISLVISNHFMTKRNKWK